MEPGIVSLFTALAVFWVGLTYAKWEHEDFLGVFLSLSATFSALSAAICLTVFGLVNFITFSVVELFTDELTAIEGFVFCLDKGVYVFLALIAASIFVAFLCARDPKDSALLRAIKS